MGDTAELHPKALEFPLPCLWARPQAAEGLASQGMNCDFLQKVDLGLPELLCCPESQKCLWIYILQGRPTSPVCLRLKCFPRCGHFIAQSKKVPGKLRSLVTQCSPNTTSGQSLANIWLVQEYESPVPLPQVGTNIQTYSGSRVPCKIKIQEFPLSGIFPFMSYFPPLLPCVSWRHFLHKSLASHSHLCETLLDTPPEETCLSVSVRKSQDVSVIEIHKAATNFPLAKFLIFLIWTETDNRDSSRWRNSLFLVTFLFLFHFLVSLGQCLGGKDGRNGSKGQRWFWWAKKELKGEIQNLNNKPPAIKIWLLLIQWNSSSTISWNKNKISSTF